MMNPQNIEVQQILKVQKNVQDVKMQKGLEFLKQHEVNFSCAK